MYCLECVKIDRLSNSFDFFEVTIELKRGKPWSTLFFLFHSYIEHYIDLVKMTNDLEKLQQNSRVIIRQK
jgi:hypothetical protein